jgi:hypothetical protein
MGKIKVAFEGRKETLGHLKVRGFTGLGLEGGGRRVEV